MCCLLCMLNQIQICNSLQRILWVRAACGPHSNMWTLGRVGGAMDVQFWILLA